MGRYQCAGGGAADESNGEADRKREDELKRLGERDREVKRGVEGGDGVAPLPVGVTPAAR